MAQHEYMRTRVVDSSEGFVCPFISDGRAEITCVSERCMAWVRDEERCVLINAANRLAYSRLDRDTE